MLILAVIIASSLLFSLGFVAGAWWNGDRRKDASRAQWVESEIARRPEPSVWTANDLDAVLRQGGAL